MIRGIYRTLEFGFLTMSLYYYRLEKLGDADYVVECAYLPLRVSDLGGLDGLKKTRARTVEERVLYTKKTRGVWAELPEHI